MKNTFMLLGLALFVCSCTVTESLKTSQRKLNRQAETNAMNTRLVNKPILAELEVGTKRETTTYKTTNKDIASSIVISGGSDNRKGNFLVSASETMKNEAKNRAQFKFMEDYKCDYLVDPIYKIETESTSGSTIINITVEVSAYPASYEKFTQPDSLPKSVMQLGSLDSREIPLMTNATTTNRSTNDSKAESGFMFGPNFSNVKKDENGDKIDYNKGGIGGSIGFYTLFPISGNFGFRTEYLITTRSYDTDFNKLDTLGAFISGDGKISYRYWGLDVPLMLNLKASENLHLQTGFSLNLSAVGRYKNDYTIFDNNGNTYSESGTGSIDSFDANMQLGYIIGAYLQTESSFGLGIRQQFGLGVDKWSTTQLMLGFRF